MDTETLLSELREAVDRTWFTLNVFGEESGKPLICWKGNRFGVAVFRSRLYPDGWYMSVDRHTISVPEHGFEFLREVSEAARILIVMQDYEQKNEP